MHDSRDEAKIGFTLPEAVLVLVVMSVVGVVGVQAYEKHKRHSIAAEAESKLAEMYRSSVVYFNQEQMSLGNPPVVLPQFPGSVGPSPGPCIFCARSPDGLCSPSSYGLETWDTSSWQALNFAIYDPHHYVYEFVSQSGHLRRWGNEPGGRYRGEGSMFTARALGDLDDDGRCSTFERTAVVDDVGVVRGSPGVFRHLPEE